jgi:hypothetical protein
MALEEDRLVHIPNVVTHLTIVIGWNQWEDHVLGLTKFLLMSSAVA